MDRQHSRRNFVAGLIQNTRAPDEDARAKASTLVAAAEKGFITRETLVAAFGDDDRFDIDGALYQLDLAYLVARCRSRCMRKTPSPGYGSTSWPGT